MLLNLASLAHPIRHARWVRRPPAVVYVLDELNCLPRGLRADLPNPIPLLLVGLASWAYWAPGAVVALYQVPCVNKYYSGPLDET